MARPPHPMPFASRSAVHLALAAICLLAVVLSLWVVTPEIALDDPFIGLRYARNWVAGDGLVYNADEPPVEGYTAFLWVIIAAPAIRAGIEPLHLWQAISVLAQIGTLWALFALGAGGRRRAAARALLAPLLLAVHVSFVAYPMLGMGTSFLTLVVTLAVLLIARRRHAGPLGAVGLGLALLVIALTRFDGLGLAGLLLAWVLLVERRWKATLWAALPLGLGLGLYNLWRLAFYGALLPNTFYAKTSHPLEQLGAGIAYLSHFALRGGPFWLLLLVPVLARLWTDRFPARPMPAFVPLSSWVTVGYLAYVLVVGGDWMPHFRFVLPVLPLLCLLLQEAFWWGLDRLDAGGSPRSVMAAVRGVGVAGLVLVSAAPLVASAYVREVPRGGYWDPVEARAIGRALNEGLPPETLVAVEWAGIIPYYLERPVLDIFGLSEAEITRSEFPGSRMGRAITPEYLVERAPDVVIYAARLYRSADLAAAAGPEIRGEGLWITGFYSSLLEPRYGYVQCVMRLGPERYWPVLVRGDWKARRELCLPATQ